MSEIINETINELNKPTQNNVFSIEDNPVTVLEKMNQIERYLKQIDTSVDTSINTANEALEKANNAFEANGTLVKINGENQLTWSADFAESERQKSKNLFDYAKFQQVGRANYYLEVNVGSSIGVYAPVVNSGGIYCWIEQYDENKTLLKGSNYWEDKFILQLEPTTKYLRFDTVEDYAQFMICYANSVDEIGNYQPYNGAIVHEKDIEPVLIYDKDTKNTIGETAYTNGVKFGASTNINVAGYSKIKTYSRVYNTYNITEVVIDKTGWTGNSFMVFGEASAIKNVGILIYTEGTNITPAECFNFSDGTGINNNDNAYVYRIEGVK